MQSVTSLAPKIISTGGTPNLKNLGLLDGATEHRSGTSIFNDRMMMAAGVANIEDCALTVYTSVVSRAEDTTEAFSMLGQKHSHPIQVA